MVLVIPFEEVLKKSFFYEHKMPSETILLKDTFSPTNLENMRYNRYMIPQLEQKKGGAGGASSISINGVLRLCSS